MGSGSEGVRRWEEAPEKHNGTPRVETKGVKSVHGHGRKRSRAEFSQQEVRQTSEGDVLRGAKMQRGGVRMGMGAEGCGGRGGLGGIELFNIQLRHVLLCALALGNVSLCFIQAAALTYR